MPACLLLLTTALTAASPPAIPRTHLLIDRSASAYTVLTTVPADALAEVRRQIGSGGKLELRLDADLAYAVAEVWTAQVRRDDYAADLRSRLPVWLHEQPLTPLGLSWNGGIAVTYGDYRHAEREYERWRAAPQAYSPPTRARDPLAPDHHRATERP